MRECLGIEYSLTKYREDKNRSYLEDLANTYKHIIRGENKIQKNPRSGRILQIISEGKKISEITLVFARKNSTDIEKVNGFDLIDGAIQEWQKIFGDLEITL